ncbi:SAM-dependent methyltransferase [Sphingomonadaceae bacterium G21617-S1]|jgi:phosphatidylethanolamine/phosphatidyl-N-methylethanolamine N-methyltransferase|uniref:class I SAM-dependent methyltransferase n=1 Tax=Rhizorhabdus sp. TaxID=1968843 RepID=UPI00120DE19E|nr:SAM-dependent methyltransferase [Rhizorhabdus sp.]MBD3760417.1 SAM-dependent methyltransferase [Rhizorhabdus sp.]MCZ4340073.1 SAM-dependent methyltransferase [Sphingomonadaceae bacterium G21617-S1]TAK12452.1 MAG: SAM-dependent methyltransferase [Rhizorhabdus sp.]
MSDLAAFLRAWAKDPMGIAAVAPSSPALAKLITAEITPDMAPVIELGPGTGVFTKALLARGLQEADLILVEYEADFARLLAARFPEARVLRGDAARVRRHRALLADGLAGATISGLPILNMNARQQMMIMRGCFDLMRPGGRFFQFTYSPACPIRRPVLERLGLKARRLSSTLRNLPPAAVYEISRRDE